MPWFKKWRGQAACNSFMDLHQFQLGIADCPSTAEEWKMFAEDVWRCNTLRMTICEDRRTIEAQSLIKALFVVRLQGHQATDSRTMTLKSIRWDAATNMYESNWINAANCNLLPRQWPLWDALDLKRTRCSTNRKHITSLSKYRFSSLFQTDSVSSSEGFLLSFFFFFFFDDWAFSNLAGTRAAWNQCRGTTSTSSALDSLDPSETIVERCRTDMDIHYNHLQSMATYLTQELSRVYKIHLGRTWPIQVESKGISTRNLGRLLQDIEPLVVQGTCHVNMLQAQKIVGSEMIRDRLVRWSQLFLRYRLWR